MTAVHAGPELARINQLLAYDPLTGIFTWKVTRGPRRAGEIAGSPHNKGYWTIRVDGRAYLAQQLAWLIHYGVWPTTDVDHRDTDRLNNRIGNLREGTRSQNIHNSPVRARNKSGFKGVYQQKGKWRAQLRIGKNRMSLGLFDTAEEASEVYRAAARKHVGEFAYTGAV